MAGLHPLIGTRAKRASRGAADLAAAVARSFRLQQDEGATAPLGQPDSPLQEDSWATVERLARMAQDAAWRCVQAVDVGDARAAQHAWNDARWCAALAQREGTACGVWNEEK